MELPGPAPIPGPWQSLRILLEARLRMLWRPAGRPTASSGRGANRAWVRYVIIVVVVVALALSVTARLIDVVGGPAGRMLLEALLTFASTVTSVALFLFALPAVMAAFTYKSDLKLLLLTPVSPRLLILEKFAGLYGQLSALLLIIGIPVFLGLGRALNLGPGYSVSVILALLLLPVAPLSLALLMLVATLRWVPPRWARTITAVLGTAFGLLFYIGTQLLAGGAGVSRTADLQQLLAQSPAAWWQSLPTTWPGQALSAATADRPVTAATYLGVTAILGAAMATVAILLAARLFTSGWATYQETRMRGRIHTGVGPASAPLPAALQAEAAPPHGAGTISGTAIAPARVALDTPPALHPAGVSFTAPSPWRTWWTLWRKEWRTVRRDPQLLARLAYPLVIVAFGFYRSLHTGSSGTATTTQGTGQVAFIITMAMYVFFLATFLSLRLVNREGRSLYLLGLAPVSARDVLLVKWAFAALPITAIAAVLLLAGSPFLQLPIWAVLLAVCAFAGLTVAITGALQLISLFWPRLDWDNPARQVSTQASLAGMVGGLILTGAVCALLAMAIGWSSSQPLPAVLAGLGVFVLTGGIATVSLMLGVPTMERLLRGA